MRRRLTLVLATFAFAFLLFCNGQTPGVTKCSTKMHQQGVRWDKMHAGLLNQADQMRKQADDIFRHYFKGLSEAYARELATCSDLHDYGILNISKVGIDDVLDKWQHPKIMGLPDFEAFISEAFNGLP